jgi:DNA (cytosine-5)-methyltransferase 1
MELVASLFPGIDILGRGFRDAGFAVLQGPDLIFGTCIEGFALPAGHIDGVIAGPPCQNYSDANRDRDQIEGDRLLLELLRTIDGARPAWFLVENVRRVPDLVVAPYQVQRIPLMDWEFGGRQLRLRHIQFGSLDRSIIRPLRTQARRPVTLSRTVLCKPGGPGDRPVRRAALQGLQDLSLQAFRSGVARRLVGNAVPYHVASALALAVILRSPQTAADCVCLCGRLVTPPAKHATAACRKRMERRRRGHVRALTWPQ